MHKKEKRSLKRTLPLLLAAVLWVEGTFGTAYAAETGAAEPALSDGAAYVEEEYPISGGTGQPGSEEYPISGGTDHSAEEGYPISGGTGQPAAEEHPISGDTDHFAEEETGETVSANETSPEPVEEGEQPVSGGDGDTPAEETEASLEKPAVSENTVPENTAADEDAAEWNGECALGDAPLMTDRADGNAIFSQNSISAMADENQAVRRQTPAVSEIIDRYKEYPWKLDENNSFSEKPSAASPYRAGHLSSKSLENALNLLNFIRYVAGIPADVTLNETYMEKVQSGALLNRVNGKLDHSPAQPEGFPDDLYAKGKEGCGKSNLAVGYGNIAKTLLNGWMYDGDKSNIDRMGHRRWILNPAMTQTGFGAVDSYAAMYAFDRSGAAVSDFVAWPAQNMPIELMNGTGTPWTLSLGSDYGLASFKEVTVTLKDVSNNKSWTFSGASANGVFKVNVEFYGMPNCIIFRPNNVSYDKNSKFQVSVSGIRDKNGEAAEINYSVDFFSLQDTPAEVKEVVLNKERMHLLLKDQDGKAQEEVLLATVNPGNAADKMLTWKSTDETVATVDGNGRVVAVGVGMTEISATSANGVQDVCTVKVSDYSLQSDAEGFSGDEGTKTYRLGFDLTMNTKPGRLVVMDGNPAQNGGAATDRINWISENERIAEVGADGVVTPKAVGETVIWADVDDGLVVLACEVKVEDSELPQIELREKTCALTITKDAAGNVRKESRKLRLYFSPADSKWASQGSSCVRWTSGDPAVAAFVTEQTDGMQNTVETISANTVSGNSVTVTAVGAGETEVFAVIVNEEGEPVTDSGGKTAETSCTVTVRAEAEPADQTLPVPIVLTNIHTTLREVALPEGFSWEEPDTEITQFAGGKTKKFAALYRPPGADETILPARRLIEVCFLTVENISIGRKTGEGTEQESMSLMAGQSVESYVNYSFTDALEQLENRGDYKNNSWYNKQKEEILKTLREKTMWSSSEPEVLSVELTADGAKLTAKSAGSAVVTASLALGGKTLRADRSFTVKAAGGGLVIKSVEKFTLAGDVDSAADQPWEKYTGLLSDFQRGTTNQPNSKIALTLPGATKITAKSGNPKVVAVKQTAVEGDGFAVSLIVQAAGTAEITLTGNDASKTSRTIRLAVGDAEPGLSAESVTVNLLQTAGATVSLYPARRPDGTDYGVTGVDMASDEKSARFTLTQGETADSYTIKAKSGVKTGTYKVKICAVAEGKTYDLPLTVKVVSKNPVCKVTQARKLNLFHLNDESPLRIDTDETIKSLECTGLADYSVVKKEDGYYIRAREGATDKSVKRGQMQLVFEGWVGTYTIPFTAGVEKKAPEIIWDTNQVTMYPKADIRSVWIGIKNPGAVSWDSVRVETRSGNARGNYTVKVDRERGGLLLSGKNLNRTDRFKMQIFLSDPAKWAEKETVSHTLQVKVSMGRPAIALDSKTLQLNADAAYHGYDAASTAVRWKSGGILTTDQGIRVSVYCDAKDEGAEALVRNSQIAFSVKNAQVFVRLNNRAVATGSYKYVVQAAKNGQIWTTPLTIKVVNTAPEKAVKLTVKGSIDVLDREGGFATLTPSLKAVNGSFVIPKDGTVKLTGRDAHLFRAAWSADGKTIELRAKRNETLVTKYQYTVTPLLTLRNVNGETEEISAPAVKLKVKQGSVKVAVLPKTALMYSGAYNSAEIDMSAVLKGAPEPEIDRVVLSGNTDAFAYVYNKDGKGTLTMKDTGRAVKGRTYSLQFQVFFAEQADNVKPVTVKCKVKVK